MNLKKIELKGFKSFADKTVVDFQSGITGIVGPNGSGKSNISDAIRWVLGEQSAKSLRGSKMEDIIFNGTDKRKALNYAEISMILDNTDGKFPLDFREVIVTRRVFRTGESEFYINKTACRLKDIKELFMDTGIGAEGYSIIGQGKIDEILSSKAEDRRKLFEEAVGIVKYKTRKQHAERKLERTNDNLTRIQDIILELEKQIGPLEKQSKKAQKYLEIKEELQKEEHKYYAIESQRIHGELNNVDKKIETINSEIAALDIEIEDNLKISEDKLSKLKYIVDILEKNQEERFKFTNDIEKTEGSINLLNEKNSSLNRESIRLKTEIEIAQTKHNDLENELALEEDEHKKYKLKLSEIKNEINTLEQELSAFKNNSNTSAQSIQKLQADYIDILNTISDLKSKKSSSIAFKENIEHKIQELELEKVNSKIEFEELNKELETLSSNKESLNKEKNVILEKYNNLITNGNQIQLDIKNFNNKQIELEKKIGIQISKKKLLQDMQNSYEGFYNSVKLTLKAIRDNNSLKNGFEGVFAELIRVSEKYETAIELALGSTTQNLVTQNEYDAKKILEYVKKNQLGRVTFMPLDAVKGSKIDVVENKIDSLDGFIDVGSNLVECDNKYRGIVDYALGKVLVFDVIENAIKAAKKTNHRYKIITLDGEIFNPGGIITGGSVNKKSTKLLSRIPEIENIQKTIDSDLLELDSFKANALNKELDLVENSKKIELEKEILEEYNNKINENSYLIKTNNAVTEEKKRKNNSVETEAANLSQEIDKLEQKLEEIDLEIDIKTQETQEALEEIQILNQNVAEFSENVRELESKITGLKVQKASVLEREEAVRTNIEQKTNLMMNFNEEKLQKQKAIELIHVEKSENEKMIANEEKMKQINIENTTKLDIEIQKSRVEKEKLTAEISELEGIKSLKDKTLDEIKSKRSSYQIEKEKYIFKTENLKEKLLEDYNLTLEELDIDIELDMDLNVLNQNIASLKNRIKAIGNVNIDSIEEFVSVKERYDFLIGQQVDLEEAKNSLEKVIHEMEVQMQVLFKENFEIIRNNFVDIFVKLFGGGRADIKLTDEEDFLNAGIEIIAQPPGKKLQNILLLSGGEKALTAIALLFAILKMKPSPFCVLDEIEAALDDANVDRFANYLRTYSSTTQFIVITHRKGTMEAVDSLYGVTMEEKGVSKIVSVKLSEDNINQFIQ